MKRFALGCLGYSACRFNRMLLGDFLDAMAGYYEKEKERTRNLTEIIRIATTYIVNTQPIEGGSRTPQELWPLPWDKDTGTVETISEEEKHRRQKAQDDYLLKHYPG